MAIYKPVKILSLMCPRHQDNIQRAMYFSEQTPVCQHKRSRGKWKICRDKDKLPEQRMAPAIFTSRVHKKKAEVIPTVLYKNMEVASEQFVGGGGLAGSSRAIAKEALVVETHV